MTYETKRPDYTQAMVIEDRRRGNWFWLDNAVIDQHAKALGPAGVAVYCYLARKANGDGQCFPSYQTIGDALGLSRRYAMQMVKKLEALGLISLTFRLNEKGAPTSNVITLLRVVNQSSLGSEPEFTRVVNQSSPYQDTHEQDVREQAVAYSTHERPQRPERPRAAATAPETPRPPAGAANTSGGGSRQSLDKRHGDAAPRIPASATPANLPASEAASGEAASESPAPVPAEWWQTAEELLIYVNGRRTTLSDREIQLLRELHGMGLSLAGLVEVAKREHAALIARKPGDRISCMAAFLAAPWKQRALQERDEREKQAAAEARRRAWRERPRASWEQEVQPLTREQALRAQIEGLRESGNLRMLRQAEQRLQAHLAAQAGSVA